MKQTVTACSNCASHNRVEEHMTLVMGQEGEQPKEIVLLTCLDCGAEEHDTISS